MRGERIDGRVVKVVRRSWAAQKLGEKLECRAVQPLGIWATGTQGQRLVPLVVEHLEGRGHGSGLVGVRNPSTRSMQAHPAQPAQLEIAGVQSSPLRCDGPRSRHSAAVDLRVIRAAAEVKEKSETISRLR